MKKLIILSLFALYFQSSFAQSKLNNNSIKVRETERKSPILKRINARQIQDSKLVIQGNKLYKKGAKQKLDNMISEDIDSFENLSNSHKEEFTYDGNGRFLTRSFIRWDMDESKWLTVGMGTLNRDANGLVTQSLYLEWDEQTMKMENESKQDETYDTKNNLISDIGSDWDKDLNKWVNSYKNEYSYSGSNQLLKENYMEWDDLSNKWEPYSIIDYAYDSKGDNFMEIQFEWNGTLNKFDSLYKAENIFDSNNNELTTTGYAWHKSLNKWLPSDRGDFTYDSKGNMLTDIYLFWSNAKNKFINSTKIEYTYDSKDNMLTQTYYDWNDKNSIWDYDFSGRNEYTYDINIAADQLILPFATHDNDQLIKYKITQSTHYTWNKNSLKWVKNYKTTYNYSDFSSSSINEIAINSALLVFPNPTSGNVYVKFQNLSEKSEVRIFDITGKSVVSKTIDNSSFINVEALNKGIYILQVFDGNNLTGTRKLVLD